MANAVRYKQPNLPRQNNEVARLKVVKGPDQGAVYVVTGVNASIGRGENNDVVISDLKASRNHAQLIFLNPGWKVKDLGSANGIQHQGTASREVNLNAQDVFTVGETTLEFITESTGTSQLSSPIRSSEQVQKSRIDAVRQSASFGLAFLGKDKKKVIIYGGVAVGALMLFTLDTKPKSVSKKADSSAPNLASYLPPVEVNRTAEVIFKDGLREYYNGNFNRARTQFETVLQITPGHPLASLYLENCETSVKEEVKNHLGYGKKASQAGKLREAKAHYERVMRLLYKDQTNPNFVESREEYQKMVKMISEGAIPTL